MKLLILITATLTLIQIIHCTPIEINSNNLRGTFLPCRLNKKDDLNVYGLDDLLEISNESQDIDTSVGLGDAAIFDFDEDVDDDAEDVDAEQDDNEDVDSEEVDADEDEEEE